MNKGIIKIFTFFKNNKLISIILIELKVFRIIFIYSSNYFYLLIR